MGRMARESARVVARTQDEVSAMEAELHTVEDRMAMESSSVLSIAHMELGADRAARAARLFEVEEQLQSAQAVAARVEANTEAARAELNASRQGDEADLRTRSARGLALITEDMEDVAAEERAGHLLAAAAEADGRRQV